jgi:hypothetical protein
VRADSGEDMGKGSLVARERDGWGGVATART